MPSIFTPVSKSRRVFGLISICIGMAALSLGGCSGKIYPFGKGKKAMPRFAAQTPPPLYLAALQGTPHNISVKLVNHLAYEARRRNMKFARKETTKTVRITGQFSTARDAQGSAIKLCLECHKL